MGDDRAALVLLDIDDLHPNCTKEHEEIKWAICFLGESWEDYLVVP